MRVRELSVSLLLVACAIEDGVGDSSPADSEGDADDDDDDDPTGGVEPDDSIVLSTNASVDILFVIDNSGSMGEEQRKLSWAMSGFLDALDDLDLHIGITTTDNGNPTCGGTTPEGGNMVFSSCRSRIGDFELTTGMIDASAACLDFCPPEWEQIEQTTTTIAGSSEAAARPWIESHAGVTNLPAGLDLTTAMHCLLPQGINGCGFEQPLESMRLAMLRANNEYEDELGFIRDDAVLAIVFLTDEADCSYNSDWATIFANDVDGGNEVFWSLPDESSPTSAVCWNAAVDCRGGPGTYDICLAANKDVGGVMLPDATADDDAVMHPVARYIDFLQEIEADKQALEPDRQVVIAAIDGVPENYPDAPIVYADGPDGSDPTSDQAQFGIAPGCVAADGQGVPPVRMREVAEHFERGDDDFNLFSVCAPSYEDHAAAIASAIRSQIHPACMRACVADSDPAVEGLQPNCAVTHAYRDDDNTLVETTLAACEAGDVVPEGVDVCYVLLADSIGLTSDTADDMSATCIDEGWNLEFRIVRRSGVPAPVGAQVSATCSLSQNKAIDCPGLP
jgi:hypothetical protein